MRSEHPQTASLVKYLTASGPNEESLLITEHLLASCPICTRRMQEALSKIYLLNPPARAADSAYDQVLTRTSAAAHSDRDQHSAERSAAVELWANLLQHPHDRRMLLVTHHRRYATVALMNLVLEAAKEKIRPDPAAAHDHCELALAIADRLPATVPETVRQDLLGSALGFLGNALRVLGNYDRAAATFTLASEALDRGSGQPLDRALLLSHHSSLLKELGQFEQATADLFRARRLYQRVGDRHEEGKVLYQMAEILAVDDPAASLRTLYAALRLIDFDQEPRLRLMTTHRLIWSTNDIGEPWRAFELLDQARPLYQSFTDPFAILARFWLKGRIFRNLSQLPEAEDLLLRASTGLAELAHALDYAVCSIDYAHTLLLRGLPDRASTSLERSHSVLLDLGVDPQTLGGWIGLIRAPEPAQMHALAAYLLRYWHTPPERRMALKA